MPFAVPSLSFTRTDILPVLKDLAWSSLPIIIDQLVKRVFIKTIPFSRGPESTVAGFVTCIAITYLLPSNSPAKVGAPALYLAYRAALSYWNRAPRPSKAPTGHMPPETPEKQSGSSTQVYWDDFSSSSTPSTPAARSPEETPASSPDASSPVTPPAAAPIPAIILTPPSPEDISKEQPLPKPEEKKAAASDQEPIQSLSDLIRKQDNEALLKHQRSVQNATTLNHEMYHTAVNTHVKVKITYLPKKETGTESQQIKGILKNPEVIQTDIRINATRLFKLSSKALPTLLPELKEKYSITEATSFCWVFLANTENNESHFPFDYLPIERLRMLNKKATLLKIETEEKVLEIEFLGSGVKSIQKCLKKLDKCKAVADAQSRHALIPVNFEDEWADLCPRMTETLIVSNCYLTPLKKI